jgi:hypothetical protein
VANSRSDGGNAAPQVCASFQNRANQPFIAGNAESQARANASSGEVRPRLLAVEVLLADPEALGNDALEGDLYILRDRRRGNPAD